MSNMLRPKTFGITLVCGIFPHMRLHFSAFSLSNVVLRPLYILAANDHQYLQSDVE